MANQDSNFGGSEVMYPAVTTQPGAQPPVVPSAPYGVPGSAHPAGMQQRGPEVLHGAFDQTWLMNCLRRRWLSALLLGLLSAVLVGIFLLWLFPLSAEVVALIQIENHEGSNFLEDKPRVTNPKDYEIFQQTQLALIKSQSVLNSALMRPEVSQTDAVVSEEPNELQWLMDELQVAYPGEGKILMIKYEGEEKPEEMKTIINAVISAYQQEIVYKARSDRQAVQSSMKRLYQEVKDDLKDKTDKMQALQEQFSGPETPNSTAKLNMIAREIALLQTQKISVAQSRADLDVNYVLQRTQVEGDSVLNEMIMEALDNDPMLMQYREQEFYLQNQITEMQALTKRGNSPQVKSLMQSLQYTKEKAEQYRMTIEQEMRDRYEQMPNDALKLVVQEYAMRRQQLDQQMAELTEELKLKYEEAEALGMQNSELSLLVSEVEQLNEVSRTMDFKLRAWEADAQASDEQIKVIQDAFVTEQINIYERLAIAGVGALGAFGLTCYAVSLIEFRRRRLNAPENVDEGLGIRVLGVLPPVASRKAMSPGSTTAAQLAESIDNVRATLMHDSTSSPRQVVLVASPSSMEGSTTVASHLALSLTRAGRRTLLVDGDLRDPSLHKLFGMPVEDGLSELLRSEIEVSDAVRPTTTEGLWLMTAGLCDVDAVHALATDQLQPIFDKLRAEFDFIIVDGAPFLGLSDSLSIGQHADGAILTVLRDHSGIKDIYQASELLKSLGIRLIGSVVNGMPFKADRRITRLTSASPSKRKRITADTAESSEE